MAVFVLLRVSNKETLVRIIFDGFRTGLKNSHQATDVVKYLITRTPNEEYITENTRPALVPQCAKLSSKSISSLLLDVYNMHFWFPSKVLIFEGYW